MVHTAFASEENYKKIYKNMKKDLQEFIDSKYSEKEEYEFYDNFTSKY